MIVIGIDPGITGAIAYIDGDGVGVHHIPTMANGKGSSKVKQKVDPAGVVSVIVDIIHDGLGDRLATVYLERVSSMPGQGVASMFSMGDTFGCIRGVVAAMGIPVHIITPQAWKKHYRLGSDKEVIRAKAIELFPEMPLSRKKDHNRAEALLIAWYGYQQESGGWL
jgi:crossover junction endodeoxyribonuclease RuvC